MTLNQLISDLLTLLCLDSQQNKPWRTEHILDKDHYFCRQGCALGGEEITL